MNFFYGNEPDMFTFFKIPKLLFSEPYRDISTDAKLLFGLMLDRMALSSKSQNWIDPDGRVYIYFTVEEVMETLNVGKNKALNLYKELETCELIQRERQPFGKPAKIYVRKFFAAARNQRGGENQTSTGFENKPLRFENQTSTCFENKPLPYKTDFKETDTMETYCAEPPKAPPAPPVPPVFRIPLNDNSFLDVTAEMVENWRGLYPAVNIEQTMRNIIGWCEANPKKRKTKGGVMRFVNAWLSKEQDKGGTRNGAYQGGGYGGGRAQEVPYYSRNTRMNPDGTWEYDPGDTSGSL